MTGMVTGAAHRISTGELDLIQAILDVVDQRSRVADERWGLGRLATLVPIDLAERFASQKRKLSAAVFSWTAAEVKKHGEAMVRAYDKLEEVATAAGHEPQPAEQWELAGPDGPIILVRDRKRMNQVETGGRRCQVWSLDEIEEVIRKHPILACAKQEFPGAEVETIRPVRAIKTALNDSLEGLPL